MLLPGIKLQQRLGPYQDQYKILQWYSGFAGIIRSLLKCLLGFLNEYITLRSNACVFSVELFLRLMLCCQSKKLPLNVEANVI
jgi:hypothetical protein